MAGQEEIVVPCSNGGCGNMAHVELRDYVHAGRYCSSCALKLFDITYVPRSDGSLMVVDRRVQIGDNKEV